MIRGEYASSFRSWPGLGRAEKFSKADPAVQVLIRMLGYFFPATSNEGHTSFQARPYIRLSALGRGVLPKGTPDASTMLQIFEAFGFAHGGRADHLSGPWASILGPRTGGLEFRNECIAFLQNNENRSKTISEMIERIRRNMHK